MSAGFHKLHCILKLEGTEGLELAASDLEYHLNDSDSFFNQFIFIIIWFIIFEMQK